MKKTKKCSIKPESGTHAITKVFQVEFLSSSAHLHPSVAMKRCSNIVCTLPSWCTWGLYGNQDGITWLWRTIRANQWDNAERRNNKIQLKSQIMPLVTFIPALPKMSLCVFVFARFLRSPWSYCLCKPVMTVGSVKGVYRGEEHECLFTFYYFFFNGID